MQIDFLLLNDVLTQLEIYHTQNTTNEPLTTAGFAAYLLANNAQATMESEALNTGNESFEERKKRLGLDIEVDAVNSTISQFIVFLYRYSKQYTKKALKHTELKTIDEFTYLSTLLAFNSLSKMELINKSMQEKTTGMETIKRLLHANLIAQSNNPTDLRSQLIHITDNGKRVLYSAFATMQTVLQIMPGNLTLNEKLQLAYLLKKLDVYHNEIFIHKRNVALENLIFIEK